MGQVNGVFIYDGQPRNGATAKLWQSGGFVSAPELDDSEPDVGYQEGATLTTGTGYGGDGAYRWTSVPGGEYYVSVEYLTHRVWQYYKVESIEDLLTTQGDMLIKGASAIERLAKGSDGQVLAMVSGSPTWTTEQRVASDGLRNSNDAEKTSPVGSDYIKIKEIKLDNAFQGSIRIKFDLKSLSAPGFVYAKIYRNGLAIGTERSNDTGSYVTFSEDFSDLNWAINDLIQIYGKGPVYRNIAVRNMRFYYDIVGTAIAVTNQDP